MLKILVRAMVIAIEMVIQGNCKINILGHDNSSGPF
jgi:hypothetical protein